MLQLVLGCGKRGYKERESPPLRVSWHLCFFHLTPSHFLTLDHRPLIVNSTTPVNKIMSAATTTSTPVFRVEDYSTFMNEDLDYREAIRNSLKSEKEGLDPVAPFTESATQPGLDISFDANSIVDDLERYVQFLRRSHPPTPLARAPPVHNSPVPTPVITPSPGVRRRPVPGRYQEPKLNSHDDGDSAYGSDASTPPRQKSVSFMRTAEPSHQVAQSTGQSQQATDLSQLLPQLHETIDRIRKAAEGNGHITAGANHLEELLSVMERMTGTTGGVNLFPSTVSGESNVSDPLHSPPSPV